MSICLSFHLCVYHGNPSDSLKSIINHHTIDIHIKLAIITFVPVCILGKHSVSVQILPPNTSTIDFNSFPNLIVF